VCRLCDPQTGETQSCPDCGREICFDIATKRQIEKRAKAYTTYEGDLCCLKCGRERDRRHDLADDAEQMPGFQFWRDRDS
jgi:hypothetical protein